MKGVRHEIAREKEYLEKDPEKILKDFMPQIIYTHHRGDINRDHQIVYEATLTAARPYSAPYVERILCYETPAQIFH